MKPLLLLLLPLLLLSACARTISFPTSTAVPGADAAVKIKRDGNGNYALDLKVKNLAPSNRLQPARNVYVVWIDTDRNGFKNLGQIQSSSSLLSSTRKAELEAITPFKPRSVFITAEDDPSTTYPGPQVVLRTENFRLR